MGNKESIPEYVLLCGMQESGKTRFLYENLLINKWKGKFTPSEGYNYEIVKHESIRYGIWDLAGGVEFQELWQVFYKYIPFKATMFMVRLKNLNYNQEKHSQTQSQLGQARKNLHFLANNLHFKDKPLMLLINIDDDYLKEDQKKSDEEKDKKRKEIAEETAKILLWDQIECEHKAYTQIDLTNQIHFNRVFTEFAVLYKKAYK